MSKPSNVDKKSGFNRLKGLAAAAVMGAGVVGVGFPLTVRANNSNTFNINRNFGNSNTARTQEVKWKGVGIQSTSTYYTDFFYYYTSTQTSTWTYTSGYTETSGHTTGPTGSSWWTVTNSYWTTTSTWTSTSTWTNTYTYTNTSEGEGLNLVDSGTRTFSESTISGFEISDVSYRADYPQIDYISEPPDYVSGPSLFDGVLGFTVDENTFIPPSGSVSLSLGVLSADPQVNIVSGIDANVEYFFSPDAPFVRALYTLTNTYTTRTKDVELAVNGSLKFGGATVVVASSDDNTTLDDADEWVVLAYNNERRTDIYDNPPVIAFGRFGGEAPLVTPTNDAIIEDDGEFLQTYDLSIPPNSSKRVMVYMALAADLDHAKATIADLSENPEVLLEGLTEEEIASIVNYDFSENPDPEVKKKEDDDSFFGAFDLAFLLGATGALAIRNKKKK